MRQWSLFGFVLSFGLLIGCSRTPPFEPAETPKPKTEEVETKDGGKETRSSVPEK